MNIFRRYDWIELVILALMWGSLCFLVVGIPILLVIDHYNRRDFMAECLQDHKQYECDVLWHKADSSDTMIMPIPIITGR